MEVSLKEYAEKNGYSKSAVGNKALRGGFKTAHKIDGKWFIEEDEPYIKLHGVKKNKAREIAPGTVFGQWTVLGPSKDQARSKKGYLECRCSCGTISDVSGYALLSGQSKSCKKCGNARSALTKLEVNTKNSKEKYEGKTINGFFIKKIVNKEKSGTCTRCIAICPKCGREFTTRMSSIKDLQFCGYCERDKKELLEITRKVVNVDGTDLSKLRSRVNGTVNKNSRTGINGVALTKKGTYKAYINFKHKHIHLGFFTDLKDAAAARKEAEEILYNKFLDDNAGWEQRLADAMAEHKKQMQKK